MNKFERIKELKIQACKWASENVTSAEYENACDLKFAELIMKQCADFVDSQTSDKEYGVVDAWCQGKDLLKHFGVEE